MKLLYTTFPSKKAASALCRSMIDEELIACANLLESTSMYRWEGSFVEEDEVIAFCKTEGQKKDAIIDFLESEHPYEVVCVAFYDTEEVNDAYASWVGSCLG